MDPYAFAWAAGDTPESATEQCLAGLPGALPGGTLGLLYATDAVAPEMQVVLDRFRTRFPDIDWVGTVGHGLCVPGQEIYERPALACLVTDIPTDQYRLVAGDLDDFPAALLEWCGARQGTFAFVHGDPTDPAVPVLMQRLAALDGIDFVNGGLTSSQTVQAQLAGRVVQRGGLSGVLLDPGIGIVTDHSQGCSPIGPVHTISEAHGHLVVKLDGRPALEVLRGEIGEVMARDLSRLGNYVFAALPVPYTDNGDYLVRNLVGIDPQRQLVAVGDDLEDQRQLMFCRRDGNTAREDLARMLTRLRKRCTGRTVRGGVYVSCVGRGRYQFGSQSEELRAVQEALGDFPLVGFFANGEIYNGRLYGYTGVLTLFVD